MTSNPFTNQDGLPDFKNITVDKIVPTITKAIEEGKTFINDLCLIDQPPTWFNFGMPLEWLDDRDHKIVHPVSHLTSVKDSDELREAWEQCLPLLTEYGSFVGQHQGLANRYNEFKDSNEFDKLTVAQQKSVTNSIQGFTLSGINLKGEKKERFREITKRLSELTNQIENNILDAKKAWTKHITDVAELDGVPETAFGLLKQTAEEKGLDGYLITLDYPSFGPILQYATNRDLREEVFIASTTKASDQGPNAGKWDNASVIDEIMTLRFERAALLGHASPAESSLVEKMAESPKHVVDFMNDMIDKSLPKALIDNSELNEFAYRVYGYDPINPWDRSFCVEKFQQEKYALSDEEVREYFPVDKVIEGMFSVVNKLYGLEVVEAECNSVWHDDVLFFDVMDNGEKIASFYMDLYARSDKRGGAWMDEAIVRMYNLEVLQLPVAYLNCNFTPPVDGNQSLLVHYEVETLFHEFGHCLHHMLTKVHTYDVSGIRGVNWDAVELPSQIMEYWCWDREALNMISSHYKTGESIPDELFDKMIAAKNYMSGVALLRQMHMSLFDFRLHMEFDSENGMGVRDILTDVNKVLLDPPVEYSRWENSFSHIFAGGYAAGYYSYKWAEVLAADVFSVFEEKGIFDQETGQKFRSCILEMGGTKEAMELFVDFMGREPKVDALLRQCGITKDK